MLIQSYYVTDKIDWWTHHQSGPIRNEIQVWPKLIQYTLGRAKSTILDPSFSKGVYFSNGLFFSNMCLHQQACGLERQLGYMQVVCHSSYSNLVASYLQLCRTNLRVAHLRDLGTLSNYQSSLKVLHTAECLILISGSNVNYGKLAMMTIQSYGHRCMA